MIDVCADILGVPIIVISSLLDMNVSIHLPQKHQLINSPIFLAYNASASGHYDGASPQSIKESGNVAILKEETFAIFGKIRESLFPQIICYL